MKIVVALVVLAACKSRGDAPTPPSVPVKPVPDASVVDAGVDTQPPIDAATQLAIPTTQPSFGCLGLSKNPDAIACVIGTRSVNVGDTDVVLVVRPGATKIVLDHSGENDVANPDELPPDLIAKLTTALRGFEPLDHAPSTIAWKLADVAMQPGPARTTGAWTFDAKLVPDGKGAVAPKYHLTITARRGKEEPQTLIDVSATISNTSVHAFAMGDRVLVETAWSTGDEGMYGDHGDAWICAAECLLID